LTGIEFYNGIVRLLCHTTVFLYSHRSNADIIQSTLIFTQNHDDSQKSRHTTTLTDIIDDTVFRFRVKCGIAECGK